MASQKSFANVPTVSISRSKFIRNSQHKTSLKLGELTPIYFDPDILPGDTHKIDLASLIRMNTPVTPIMDNIYIDFYAFLCPNRIVWEHWKEFMGENNSSAGIYSGTEYTVPMVDLGNSGGVSVGTLGDHLGLPIGSFVGAQLEVSDLPGRMYKLIYNTWFRDQNLIAPVSVSLGDVGTTQYGMQLYKAAKSHDYFTSCLPFVQKGSPVTIPLGTSAPVTVGGVDSVWLDGIAGDFSRPSSALNGTNFSDVGTFKVGDLQGVVMREGTQTPVSATIQGTVNLAQATSATINQLRFAFQYQKLLEKDAMYGTRYWEILKAHFSVNAPDASLQRPQYLGHFRANINIDQVIQTTGINQSTPASNGLGQTAAVSVTGKKGSLCTFSSYEHCGLMILAVARHDQTYGQGVERGWCRKHRTDYYFPVFANLGAQEVKNKEIFAGSSKATNDAVFGYQEAWAEYRYKPNQVTGTLRPNITGLGYWTLANNFASLPTLSQSFIEQDRSNLARAIGSFDQDFICDFYFRDIAVRPMPLYSVPGLIDHH